MKKILIFVMIVMMSQLSIYASPNSDMRHANPLPNLVRVTLNQASVLQLDAKQIKAVQAWNDANKPKMLELVALVMSEEKMLFDEALGKDQNTIKKAQVMLDARKEIIEMKTLCRANLRTILSKKQYAQLISIYKNSLEKRQNKKENRKAKNANKNM